MTDKQLGKLVKEIRKDNNIAIKQLGWGLCDTQDTMRILKLFFEMLVWNRDFVRNGWQDVGKSCS